MSEGEQQACVPIVKTQLSKGCKYLQVQIELIRPYQKCCFAVFCPVIG